MALVRFRPIVPAVDMYETKDDLVIAAELPGLCEEDIQSLDHR